MYGDVWVGGHSKMHRQARCILRVPAAVPPGQTLKRGHTPGLTGVYATHTRSDAVDFQAGMKIRGIFAGPIPPAIDIDSVDAGVLMWASHAAESGFAQRALLRDRISEE